LADIASVFLKYGPVPRVCIALAGNKGRKEVYDSAVARALERLDATSDWLPNLSEVDGIGISNHLFGVRPLEEPYSGEPFPLSPHIARLLVQRAEAVSLAKAKEVFDRLNVPITRGAAGQIFESLVHARLRRGTSVAIKQTSGKIYSRPQEQLKVNKTPDPIMLSCSKSEKMSELIEKNNGQLLTPIQPNFPSIMLRGATMWLVQVTYYWCCRPRKSSTRHSSSLSTLGDQQGHFRCHNPG
jgi:hypothetical protein